MRSFQADLVNLLYSMVDRNVHNYSTMISWLCKYSDESSKKRAIEMFKEAVEKKWILEEDAYVGLVSQATKIDGIIDTLKTVAQLKAKPTIRLFNAVIASLHEVLLNLFTYTNSYIYPQFSSTTPTKHRKPFRNASEKQLVLVWNRT